MTEAVASAKPYHRALVDHALNRMGYWGYGDRYYRDVRASATDPNAFPDGVPAPEFWEDMNWKNGVDPTLPKEFEHGPWPTKEEVLGSILTSKSPTVAAWLLGNYPKPADADVRALARFLDSPDPRLRWAFVERVAAWTGEPSAEKPRPARDGEGNVRADARGRTVMEYPGLDAAVLRWKVRLRGGKP